MAIKRNEVLIHTTRMTLENTVIKEISWTQKQKYCMMGIESKMVLTRGSEVKRMGKFWVIHILLLFICFGPGIKLRASHMLSPHSTTKLFPQPRMLLFREYIHNLFGTMKKFEK